MTEQPFTPTEELVRNAVRPSYSGPEFDRFIAQVKRDAAWEAAHGLVARWISEFGASDAYVDMIRDEANDYLSEIYPEETSR